MSELAEAGRARAGRGRRRGRPDRRGRGAARTRARGRVIEQREPGRDLRARRRARDLRAGRRRRWPSSALAPEGEWREGGEVAAHRGPARGDPRRRAGGAELPRPPLGRGHPHRPLRAGGRGHRRPHPRHPQDHAGPAGAGEGGGGGRRRRVAPRRACTTRSWSRRTTPRWPAGWGRRRGARSPAAARRGSWRSRSRASASWTRCWPPAWTGSCWTTWRRTSCARRCALAAGRAEPGGLGRHHARQRPRGGRDRAWTSSRVGALTHSAPALDLSLLLDAGLTATLHFVKRSQAPPSGPSFRHPTKGSKHAGPSRPREHPCAEGRGSRARARARRGDPRPQLPGARGPGRGRLRGRLAGPLAPGGGRRRRRDRLLRRALHGRDGGDPLAREDRAAARPRRRLLARRLDHRRRAARLEGAAPRRRGGHVREHHRRGEGRDRLLLHLLERGPGGRAHLARARRRHRDPVRPGHVPRRLRREGHRPADERVDRRVPRARGHPPERHRRGARGATRAPTS